MKIYTILIFIKLLISPLMYGQLRGGTGFSGSSRDNIKGKYNFGQIDYHTLVAGLEFTHKFSTYIDDNFGNKRFATMILADPEETYANVGRVVSFLNNSGLDTYIDAYVFPGDFVRETSDDTKATVKNIYDYWSNNYFGKLNKPVLIGIGNHDHNSYYFSDTSLVVSKQQQRDWFIQPLFTKEKKVTFYTNSSDVDACYYYVDFNTYKIRLIMLDYYDIPQTLTGSNFKYKMHSENGYTSNQLFWLINSALRLPDALWQVILFQHTFRETDPTSDFYETTPMLWDILDDFCTNGSDTLISTQEDNAFNIPYNFDTINIGFGGTVIGCFYGHLHQAYTVKIRNYNVLSIPSIRNNGLLQARKLYTSTYDGGDCILIDKDYGRIRAIRYGVANLTNENFNGGHRGIFTDSLKYTISGDTILFKFGHGSFDNSVDVYTKYGTNTYTISNETTVSDSCLKVVYVDNSTAFNYNLSSATNLRYNLITGVNYTLKAWVKVQGDVQLRYNNGGTAVTIQSISGSPTNWTEYTTTFTCGASPLSCAVFVSGFGSGETVWFDKVDIYETP